jgi:hypothetical protein
MDDLDTIKTNIRAIFSELTTTQQPLSDDRRRLLETELNVLLAFTQIYSAEKIERIYRGIFWLTVVLAACGVIQIIQFVKELVCGR